MKFSTKTVVYEGLFSTVDESRRGFTFFSGYHNFAVFKYRTGLFIEQSTASLAPLYNAASSLKWLWEYGFSTWASHHQIAHALTTIHIFQSPHRLRIELRAFTNFITPNELRKGVIDTSGLINNSVPLLRLTIDS